MGPVHLKFVVFLAGDRSQLGSLDFWVKTAVRWRFRLFSSDINVSFGRLRAHVLEASAHFSFNISIFHDCGIFFEIVRLE